MSASSQSAGVVSAIDELRGELTAYLAHKLPSRQDVEDVLQELYVRATQLDQPERSATLHIEDHRRYVYRMAHNLAIDWLRKQQREQQHIDPQTTSDTMTHQLGSKLTAPDTALEQQRRAKLLQQALSSLPPRCRQVFMLFKFKGMSQQQIARELDITPSAVEKHVVRALMHCRQYLITEESS